MNWLVKIGIVVLIGIEVFVMNTSYIDMLLNLGLREKMGVFLAQAGFHSVIFYLILCVFTKNKRDRLNFKRSLLFFILILAFGSFRILLSILNLSIYETWVVYITRWYHFFRSPNVFAVIIPLLIVRNRIILNQDEI